MAQGDVKSALVVLTAGSTYDIRPPVGEEWTINNLYFNNGPISFYTTNGTTSVEFDLDTGGGARLGFVFRLTHDIWIKVNNDDAAISINISYDGIQTK